MNVMRQGQRRPPEASGTEILAGQGNREDHAVSPSNFGGEILIQLPGPLLLALGAIGGQTSYHDVNNESGSHLSLIKSVTIRISHPHVGYGRRKKSLQRVEQGGASLPVVALAIHVDVHAATK